MSTSLWKLSTRRVLGSALGVWVVVSSAAWSQTHRGRGLIADNDETARFRIAVAAFEQSGYYGSASLGERFGDRLAQDLERENREWEALDPDDVKRCLREYGLYLSEWLRPEQAQRLRAAFHANTLIVGRLQTTSAHARAEVISLRTGQRLGGAEVQAYSYDRLLSSTAELARRLRPFLPLEGFITDVHRYGRFEIDLGSRHGLERGMRLAILRDEGGYYGFPREVQIGTGRVYLVGSRSSEAEILDLSYGTELRRTDRVRVLSGYSPYEQPWNPPLPWSPKPPGPPEPPYYPPPYGGDLGIHAWLDSSCHHWRPGDRICIHIRVNFDGEVFVFDSRRNSRSREDALGWAACQAGREVEVTFRADREGEAGSFLVRGIDARRRPVETRVVLDPPYGPGPPPRPPHPGPPPRPPHPDDDDRPGWGRSGLDLRMNKRDGATYWVGERFSATYHVPRDCSIELWDYRPDGKRFLLVRNERAEQGRRYTVNGTVTPPTGREELVLKAWLGGRPVEERVTFHVRPR